MMVVMCFDGGIGDSDGSNCCNDAHGSKTLSINSFIQQVFIENLQSRYSCKKKQTNIVSAFTEFIV